MTDQLVVTVILLLLLLFIMSRTFITDKTNMLIIVTVASLGFQITKIN